MWGELSSGIDKELAQATGNTYHASMAGGNNMESMFAKAKKGLPVNTGPSVDQIVQKYAYEIPVSGGYAPLRTSEPTAVVLSGNTKMPKALAETGGLMDDLSAALDISGMTGQDVALPQYSNQGVRDLRSAAQAQGYRGTSRLPKAQLANRLEAGDVQNQGIMDLLGETMAMGDELNRIKGTYL